MDLKNLKPKLFGSDDERAVSPVIGVILMVAITVILAATIATLVLDLGNNAAEREASAGAAVETQDHEILATWTSEGNSDNLNVKVDYEVSGEDSSSGAFSFPLSSSSDIGSVGDTQQWTAEDLATNAGNISTSGSDEVKEISGTITITAEIDGGSTTVVSTESFTFEDVGLAVDYSP